MIAEDNVAIIAKKKMRKVRRERVSSESNRISKHAKICIVIIQLCLKFEEPRVNSAASRYRLVSMRIGEFVYQTDN